MAAKVDSFEKLVAWQRARELVRQVYVLGGKDGLHRDFGLRDQIQRSAVSVMSNIAEGFERGRRADFHRFLVIAKASCAELRSQLYVAHDVGDIPKPVFSDLSMRCQELARIIGGLRVAVQRQIGREGKK